MMNPLEPNVTKSPDEDLAAWTTLVREIDRLLDELSSDPRGAREMVVRFENGRPVSIEDAAPDLVTDGDLISGSVRVLLLARASGGNGAGPRKPSKPSTSVPALSLENDDEHAVS